MSEARSTNVESLTAQQLLVTRNAVAVSKYVKEWFQKTKDRVSQGEPFAIASFYSPLEIFIAMDIPVLSTGVEHPSLEAICLEYMDTPSESSDLIDQNGYHYYKDLYRDLAAERGYDLLGQCGLCGGTMALLGSLPKATVIVTDSMCVGVLKGMKLWSRVYNVPIIILEATASPPYYRRYPRWWERIEDYWDEIIEPHRLDYRVEEMKALIKFLEVTTGKTFSQTKLMEVMELVNEQNHYWRKAHDLIAQTIPYPVGVADCLYNYHMQWHRGKPEARDLAKMFYDEVKERVDKGEALCPNERIRLQWFATPYASTRFFRAFEEKYGAVFGCFWNLNVAADGYARSCLNDPLRALASRNLFLGLYSGPEWDIKEARLHKSNGAVLIPFTYGFCPAGACRGATMMYKMAYEAAGIPMFLIDITWDEERRISEVSNFIETRLC